MLRNVMPKIILELRGSSKTDSEGIT